MPAETSRKYLTANDLKWIAIFAMVIDHVAWKLTLSPSVYILMHAIGRLTMPIMCFLMAEGFKHTRSRKKYALRLFIFAVIAQIPFNYYISGNLFGFEIGFESLNVLFCLFFGFCALWVINSKANIFVKITVVSLCLIFSAICDWLIFGVLWILAFGLSRASFRKKIILYCLNGLGAIAFMFIYSGYDLRIMMMLGVFLPLPLFYLYNGKKFGESTPVWLTNKWLFYIFYPTHLAIIGYLYYGIRLLR